MSVYECYLFFQVFLTVSSIFTAIHEYVELKRVKLYVSTSYISFCQCSHLQDLFSIFLIFFVRKNKLIFTFREWAWKSQYIAIVPSSSSFFISCFTWQIKIIGRYMLSVLVFFNSLYFRHN